MAKNKHFGINLRGELSTFQTLQSNVKYTIAKFNGEIKFNGSLLPYIVEDPVKEERVMVTILTDEIPSVQQQKNMRCIHIMKLKNNEKEYYASTFASHYIKKDESIDLVTKDRIISIGNQTGEFKISSEKNEAGLIGKKKLEPFRPNKVMTYSLYDPEVMTQEEAENAPHTIEVLPVDSIVDLIGKKVLGVTLIQPTDTLIRRAKGAFININKIDADGRIETIQTVRPTKKMTTNNSSNQHHKRKENPRKKYVGKK